MSSNSQPPLFDERFAQQYVGKYVLIGVNYLDAEGNLKRQDQIHGIISAVSAKSGITVELKGLCEGAVSTFPPDLRSLRIADPGEYTLHTTSEVVTDPDLLWTWNINQNKQS